MRTAHYSAALASGLLLLCTAGSSVRADPPAGSTGGAAAGSSSGTKGGFLSSLKQALNENFDREIVRGHFDVGSPPDTHRFYCLIDPKTGKSEPNAVAGEPFVHRDGTTGLKGPAVSPLSCANAEQKGILVTTGYKMKGRAVSVPGSPGPVPAAEAAAPAAAPAPGTAPVSTAAAAQGSGGNSRWFEVRGARLYTETFGHGPPLLFLHGRMMFFDNAFEKQRDYFAAYRTVIGIDQRGHGHSPDGPWTLSYQLMADDTAAIIEQLGVGPVDVVGESDGGDIALLLARDHPQLVRRVVVSGANLRSGLTPEEVQRRRAWSAEQLAAKLKEVTESLSPNFRPDYSRVSPDGPDHWMALLSKCYFMWIEPVVIEPADLKKISAPVLVMAGDHEFTSLEETIEIFRGLPRGQLFILPATGHGTLQKRPELVNPAIREFFELPESRVAAGSR